jgi:hypothetical protein
MLVKVMAPTTMSKADVRAYVRALLDEQPGQVELTAVYPPHRGRSDPYQPNVRVFARPTHEVFA